MTTFRDSLDFRRSLKEGPYTSLGSYPIFWLMSDGETMCFACAQEEAARISLATYAKDRSGWAAHGYDANWEDPDMYCCNCNERIQSAYAEPDAVTG